MNRVNVLAPAVKTIIAHPSNPLCEGLLARIKRWKIHPTPPVYTCSSPGLYSYLEKNGGDVVILYDSLPGTNGSSCYCELLQIFPSVKIILLTENTDSDYFSKAVQAGVKGFVHHFTTGKEFKKAIPAVMNNQIYYCPVILGYIKEKEFASSVQLLAGFTPREVQVHNHMLKKYRAKDSARELNISQETVKTRRSSLRKKLLETKQFSELEKISRKKK